ncbi:MAG: acetyl-CoA carboxylase biotin carboxyl carrier protein [Lachnospiraceae bacterium]|nr:acetyl-CoA carboxylase biotin carboxyl carrier protein [Lachnospiraceae bacterium]
MTVQEIKELIQAVSNSDITEFKYNDEQSGLFLKKKVQVVAATEMPVSATLVKTGETAVVEATGQPEGNLVCSPLVGTAYLAPAEDAEVFVQVGDTVKKGQTLAIVEAMKLMNEIESDYDGTVQEILVENGQTVEYGQPMFVIA